MYNLFVSQSKDSWNGEPWEEGISRCLQPSEYTEESISRKYSFSNTLSLNSLYTLPCVFAFESKCCMDAKIGRVTRVRSRNSMIRVEYEINPSYPSIKKSHLLDLKWNLGISDGELNRTHWAVKNENLSAALESLGYPELNCQFHELVDIESHIFDVALSFPGEVRDYVSEVADNLVSKLGRGSVFYDNHFTAQLARPNLDTALQVLYGKRSKLIVAFLCENYALKKWCHIEFRAIREIINERSDERVMFIRHDDAEVEGVFSTDGYIDANNHAPDEVSSMIVERISLLKRTEKNF